MANEEVIVQDPVVEELPQTGEAAQETEDPTAASEEGDGDGSADPENPQQDPEGSTAKPKNSAQKRIGELTRKQRDAERDAAYWKGVAQGRPTPTGASQAEPAAKPRVEQFADYETFVEALSDWKAGEAVSKYHASQQREQAATTLQTKTQDLVTKGTAKFEDFAEVVTNPDLTISMVMAEAMFESENSIEVLYHLAQRPEECERISRLSPSAQAREIGKLEVKLANATVEAKQQQAARKTTQAPAPVRPVGAKGASAQAIDLNDPSLPVEVFNREWDRLERKRRAG